MGAGKRLFSAAAVILLVGLVRCMTGTEYALSVFFLFPIVFSAWYDGLRPGLGMAVFSTLIWLGADLIQVGRFSDIRVPFINETFRLIVFLFAAALVAEFKQALDAQKKIARTDSMTGLWNRLAFFEMAALEIKRARRFNTPLSFIYTDIDNFKSVNDTSGHDTGDRLLRVAAETILNNIRKIDIGVRFGGDEMGILLVETDAGGARSLAEKLKEKLTGEMRRQGWPVTFSMGVGTFQQAAVSVEDMVQIVDKLMYFAKRSGKNRIIHQIFTGEKNPEGRENRA